jgi:hypothetical protein
MAVQYRGERCAHPIKLDVFGLDVPGVGRAVAPEQQLVYKRVGRGVEWPRCFWAIAMR